MILHFLVSKETLIVPLLVLLITQPKKAIGTMDVLLQEIKEKFLVVGQSNN